MTTPTISAVSGTQSNGNIITATTTNAMNEADANWLFPKTDSLYVRTGANPLADGFFDVQDNTYFDPPKIIAKGVGGTVSGASSFSPISGGHSTYNLGAHSTGYLWWRAYIWVDANAWPTDFDKLFWAGNSPNPSFLDFDFTGSAPQHLKVAYDGGSLTQTNSSFEAMQYQRWYCVEWGLPAAVGANDSFVYWNGVLIDQRTTGGNQGTSGGNWWEILTNLSGTSAGFSRNHYQDGTAFSTSRVGLACTIELADNSVYASANKRYQLPEKLTETQVQFRYDNTGLTGTNRYLFVTNNLGERSAAFTLAGDQPATDIVIPSARVARSSQRIWTYQ